MKDIEKLLEEMDSIFGKAEVQEDLVAEDEVKEDALQDEAPEADVALEQPEAPEEEPKEEPAKPAFNDTMSLADTFDAKARIARALETLQAAVEEFKNATADKVDLIKDALLISSIEGLDASVKAVEDALASGELLKSELNDPFNAELPGTDETTEEEPKEELPSEEDIDAIAQSFETGETSFGDLAGLDLFPNEEEQV